jgi:hypothetical protein
MEQDSISRLDMEIVESDPVKGGEADMMTRLGTPRMSSRNIQLGTPQSIQEEFFRF